MKKIFAVLSSLLIVFPYAGLSASAYSEQKVVIAVNDDSSYWVTRNITASSPNAYNPDMSREVCTYYMNTEKIADFNPSQETFEFGDIIQFDNLNNLYNVDTPGTIGTFLYAWEVGKEDQPYSISKIGSVFDNPETKQFIVTESLVLKDDEGNHYQYNDDFLEHGYYQPDCVDVSTLHSGDVVTCITYNDIPMLVTEITSSAPPSGDANGDGTLNILDVIVVNQAILGKKRLTDTDKIYHVDFNQDGVPDAADSLTMLKMIVELE